MKTQKTLTINFFFLGLVNLFLGIIFIYGSMALNSSLALFPELAELIILVTLGLVFGILELTLGVVSFMSFYTFLKERKKRR